VSAPVESSGAISASGKAGTADRIFQQLWGFGMRETAASTATVEFRDGSASGKLLAPQINLIASQLIVPWLFQVGIISANGVFVRVVSGAVEVIVYGY
jgi:hypothetical protein